MRTIYSVFLWRKGFRRDDWVNYFLLAAGVALHTLAMTQRGLTLHSCPVNNLYEATTFLLWALGLACLVYSLLPRFKFLAAFTAPVLFTVGVFALMPSLDPPHGPKPEFSGALRSLHAATILQSYGAFGLAAVAAGMFLMQQSRSEISQTPRAALAAAVHPAAGTHHAPACRGGFRAADHRAGRRLATAASRGQALFLRCQGHLVRVALAGVSGGARGV